MSILIFMAVCVVASVLETHVALLRSSFCAPLLLASNPEKLKWEQNT
jgi:hypothetical protein